MDVGFTGTQKGMTNLQERTTRRILSRLLVKWEGKGRFHHGDCIGADAQAHQIAKDLGYIIVGHPPREYSKRAFCEFDESEEPGEYLFRNTRIVVTSEILIAAPREYTERQRSGTWSTVRRARKRQKPIFLVFPDGSIKKG